MKKRSLLLLVRHGHTKLPNPALLSTQLPTRDPLRPFLHLENENSLASIPRQPNNANNTK
jgi:hypothetical protein